ncbi:hypothetical protein SAMN05443247_03803 [Bradyrhizobium erythrophlei]|nr:hypothetical protein SAMN05443247_03803 [Bradyrhizobium erythrophlei]
MMYDHEKSDPAIVAVKPTNKAGQPAAELVEPRAGAEGNVSQQSTGRAQYRGAVSQALERIRQAVRQRKKEKFTALFHHVSIDHLAEAFSELKENAAAGVDGLTCRDYERHLERNLEDLKCSRPSGSVSGTTVAAGLHTQAGWSATPDRGRDMGCIMHLVQLGFGDGKARRGEFATQSRSVRSVASVSVMAYGKPGFFRCAVTRPWSIQ